MATKMNKYDRTHLSNLSKYQRQIDTLYRRLIQEASLLGAAVDGLTGEELFAFDNFPTLKKRAERLLNEMHSGMFAVIVNGVNAEWTLANNKNSELARTVFGDNVGKLSQAQYRKYFSTNDKAREAFLARKEAGLNLSDRVWRCTNQFKGEIELGLDVGIRNGMSAAEMARELKAWLREPDKLFRRVRDEHGDLQPSRAMAAYHPGQGVYRSSYKNARRLAATETNIAYRTADYERWQVLPFVVGIEVVLSNNHPEHDICDELKGRYPKDFKFTGWHPHCRCHAVSVLKTEEEIEEDTRRILDGEEPTTGSVNTVDGVPVSFANWVIHNEQRIVKTNQLPYFITDNAKFVTGLLQAAQPSSRVADIMMTPHFKEYIAQFKKSSDKVSALSQRLSDDSLADSERAIIVNQIKQECAQLTYQNLLANGQISDEWIFARKEFNAELQEKTTYIIDGKAVKIKELKMDLLVFKDGAGREFVYPVGAREGLFKAVEASEVIGSLPPYLRRGVKQVKFLDTTCPVDPYWKIKYKNPEHKSFATDGGKISFWGNPTSKENFKGTVAHEAGHIIDCGRKFSGSREWQEAVKKDDAIFASYHLKGTHRVSSYAKTNDAEDFAECIKAYICDHDYFKKVFPNRAAYICRVAQKLSGHPNMP
jgi:hypothetical protein